MNQEKLSPYALMFESDTRFKIWMQLSLNAELNLGELARILNRSKSTIHEHLQKLLEAELIEESREEASPGRIPTKYYKLDENYYTKINESPEILRISDKKDIRGALTFINQQKTFTKVSQQISKYKMQFHDFLLEKLSSTEQSMQDNFLKIFNSLRLSAEEIESGGRSTSDIIDYMEFFSEEIYYDFMLDFLRLARKYENKQQELLSKDPNLKREFYFSGYGIPLKKIMDYLQKKT